MLVTNASGASLASFPVQVNLQPFAVGANANRAIAVGSKHRHPALFDPIKNLCMRMAKRTVLGD